VQRSLDRLSGNYAAIDDNGQEQRLIRTVSREGASGGP
jgi:hypothetical protein